MAHADYREAKAIYDNIAPYEELLVSSKKYDRTIVKNILKVLQNN